MGYLYNFGISQEDERTEAAALQLGAADSVLSIASAGDMPLSLLALGARRVEAVDVDAAQLHLTALKLAAVCRLPRQHAAALLGYRPATPSRRLQWYGAIRDAMAPAARQFWSVHESAIAAGPIWAGRFETYVRRLLRVVMPLIRRRRFDALLACNSLQEQSEVFAREFDRPRFRIVFRVAFHPRVFARRGMDPRSLRHRNASLSLGDQYFEHFRLLCTATPARDNHLLQLMLLGQTVSDDTVPEWLGASGSQALRARPSDLRLHHSDIVSWLRACPAGAFAKAHLSNLGDWLDQGAFDQVMALLADKAAPGARLVWRFLHVDRSPPGSLASRIVVDRASGAELLRKDRFPFYVVVCAQVAGQHP